VNAKREIFRIAKGEEEKEGGGEGEGKEVGTLPSTVIQGRRDIDLPLGAFLDVFLLRRLGPET
jgi:hypothetical protein